MVGRRYGGPAGAWGVHVSLLAASLLVAGCQSGPGPDAAAREWLTSVVDQDGNTTGRLTCRAAESAVQEGTLWLTVATIIGQGFIEQAVDMDISDVAFRTTSQSGSTASVHAAGPLRVAILGVWQSQPIDTVMRMEQEDGRWKYCGEA